MDQESTCTALRESIVSISLCGSCAPSMLLTKMSLHVFLLTEPHALHAARQNVVARLREAAEFADFCVWIFRHPWTWKGHFEAARHCPDGGLACVRLLDPAFRISLLCRLLKNYSYILLLSHLDPVSPSARSSLPRWNGETTCGCSSINIVSNCVKWRSCSRSRPGKGALNTPAKIEQIRALEKVLEMAKKEIEEDETSRKAAEAAAAKV